VRHVVLAGVRVSTLADEEEAVLMEPTGHQYSSTHAVEYWRAEGAD
jgi:hypothetical protein